MLIKKLFTISLMLLAFNSWAITVEGLDFPDKVQVTGQELQLNGVGIRKATWFKVKVYLGLLYLQKKTSDVKQILEQDYPKYLLMRFVYNVDKEKLVGGWNEGFKAALSAKDLAAHKKEIDTFNSFMSDIKKGQTIRINFLKDAVQVSFNKSEYQTIPSKTFAKHLLSIWFVNPRDEGLAQGLRGIN